MAYKRVLLKISGEALMGDQPFGITHEAAQVTAQKIRDLHQQGIEIGIVIGGGNIFRGIQQGPTAGIERTPADQIGMLATLINGITLQQALQKTGLDVRVMSALECPSVAEQFQWNRAMNHLKKGRIVLFVGGTGHPYFTTDTTAALRACEIHADILLKATTRVDGIYNKDPRQHPDAIKYDQISFQQVLEQRLGILDLTAVTLCMAANIPIRVFNFYQVPLVDAISARPFGTVVNKG